jgi:hypothetical protein
LVRRREFDKRSVLREKADVAQQDSDRWQSKEADQLCRQFHLDNRLFADKVA